MATVWDNYQEMVKDQMRKVYSETVIDHAMNPRNVGNLEVVEGYASVTGPCGDAMEIWLEVRNGIITKATFMTDGCGTTIASGSMITEMARGKNIIEAQRISQQDVLGALGGLPEESQHCALLAASTLKEAAKDYLALKRNRGRGRIGSTS